jgi:hypothetical protein
MQLANQSRSNSNMPSPHSVDKTVPLPEVTAAAVVAATAVAPAAAPQRAVAAPAVAVTGTAATPCVATELRARPASLSAAPGTTAAPTAAAAATAAVVVLANWNELLSVDDDDDDDVVSDVVSYVHKRSLDLQLLEKIMHAGCLITLFKRWQQQLQAPFANTTATIGSTLYALAYWRRHYVQQQNTAVECAVEQLMRVLEHCQALRTDNSSNYITDIAVHKLVLKEWTASVLQDSHRARGRLQQVCATNIYIYILYHAC